MGTQGHWGPPGPWADPAGLWACCRGSVGDLRALSVSGACAGGLRPRREPGLLQRELGPCRQSGVASGRDLELWRGSEDPVKGNVGPCPGSEVRDGVWASPRFSGFCRGPCRAGPGALPRGTGDQAWGSRGRSGGSVRGNLGPFWGCFRGPGSARRNRGSAPGSGVPSGVWALPGLVGVTGGRGLGRAGLL